MGLYGADTPKRHYFYSNSQSVHQLDKGKLQVKKFQKKKNTAHYSYDKNNKACWTATKDLTGTQLLAKQSIKKVVFSSYQPKTIAIRIR